MSRSRERKRVRKLAPVQTTDPAGLAAYAAALRPFVATIRARAEDALAPPRQRVHSRVFLRKDLLRAVRELEARIDAAAPPPAL